VAFLDRLTAESPAVVSVSDFLHAMLRAFRDELGYDSCAVALLDDRSPGALVVRAASGRWASCDGASVPAARGVRGTVLRTGMGVLVPVEDATIPFRSEEADLNAGAHVPLAVRGRVIGVLSAGRPRPETLTDGDLALLTAVGRYLGDALESARLHQQIRRSSGADALTELINRASALEAEHLRVFLNRVEAAIARCQRTGGRVSVAMMDMIGFTAAHDAVGSDARDRALSRTAEMLTRAVRVSDLAVRFGSDGFLLLLPDTTAAQAQRVVEGLAVPAGELGNMTRGAGWGIATWPDDAAGVDELLRIAAARLRAMQRGGVPERADPAPGVVRAAVRGPATTVPAVPMGVWRGLPRAIAVASLAAVVAVGAFALGWELQRRAVLPQRPVPEQFSVALVPASPAGSAFPQAGREQPRGPTAAQPRTHSVRPVSRPHAVYVRARRFLVVSGALPTAVAERRVQALEDIGLAPVPRILLLTPARARVYYGTFASEKDAQALATRVRTAGYTAGVVNQ